MIRNSTMLKRYVETYVRNNPSILTQSADTIFRTVKDMASEPGAHRMKGAGKIRVPAGHSGIDSIYSIIDMTVKVAMP
ncbi:MAG: hypothetical protein QW292_11390 [Candidatus Parvarchaeota archaeon]